MEPALRASRGRTWLALLLLAVLSGCTRARSGGGDDDDSAPDDDDAVADDDDATPDGDALTWIFREGFSASEASLALAVLQAEEQAFELVDADAESAADRAFSPVGLTEQDVAGVPDPGLALEDTLALALTGRAGHALPAYRGLVLVEERTSLTGGAQSVYTRSFPGGDDVCWGNGSCDELRAEDAFTTSNLLYTFDAERTVEVRAVDLGGGRGALVERAWLPQSALGEDGESGMLQEYRLSLMIDDEGGPRRLVALWWQLRLAVSVDEALLVNVSRSALDETFDAEDAYLDVGR